MMKSINEKPPKVKLQKGDIDLIKAEDYHPYYLLKLLKDPYETEGVVSGDYNHEFPLLN